MPIRSDTVSFRLPSAFLSQLASEAKSRGLSIHKYARQLVIETLSQSFQEEQRQEFAEVRKTLEHLREDLATAAAAILAFQGKWTPDQAKAWAKQTLLVKKE